MSDDTVTVRPLRSNSSRLVLPLISVTFAPVPLLLADQGRLGHCIARLGYTCFADMLTKVHYFRQKVIPKFLSPGPVLSHYAADWKPSLLLLFTAWTSSLHTAMQHSAGQLCSFHSCRPLYTRSLQTLTQQTQYPTFWLSCICWSLQRQQL